MSDDSLEEDEGWPSDSSPLELISKKSVAVIVCFRDLHKGQNRQKQLEQFVPYMELFFKKALKDKMCAEYKIYIIEQSMDDRKFNRGKLLNIGFKIAKKYKHDIFIFHDVDLLPSPELIPWYCTEPVDKPIHIARVWDRYSKNENYIGGITSFSEKQFESINGYPNNYWGWGGEDDEILERLKEVNKVGFVVTKGKELGLRGATKAEIIAKMKAMHMTDSEIAKNDINIAEFKLAAPDLLSASIKDLENMTLEEKLQVLRDNVEWKNQYKRELNDEQRKQFKMKKKTLSVWRTNGLTMKGPKAGIKSIDKSYKILSINDIGDDKHVFKFTVDIGMNGDKWDKTAPVGFIANYRGKAL
jgi:hypothetical protein